MEYDNKSVQPKESLEELFKRKADEKAAKENEEIKLGGFHLWCVSKDLPLFDRGPRYLPEDAAMCISKAIDIATEENDFREIPRTIIHDLEHDKIRGTSGYQNIKKSLQRHITVGLEEVERLLSQSEIFEAHCLLRHLTSAEAHLSNEARYLGKEEAGSDWDLSFRVEEKFNVIYYIMSNSIQVSENKESCEARDAYNFCTVQPTFTVKDWSKVNPIMADFVSSTRKEPGCIYNGWTKDGDTLFCREAYKDVDAVNAHL